MDISELYSFALWYRGGVPGALARYRKLHKLIHHNATQAQKLPIEEPLEGLLAYLQEMRMHELSNEQIRILRSLDVEKYVGDLGAEFIIQLIKQSHYDPASAAQQLSAGIDSLQKINGHTEQVIAVFEGLNLLSPPAGVTDGRMLIRLEFRKKASIDNVVSLKTWASQWHDIVRGASMAVNEPPNNTLVVGASRGSIIIELAATLAVARILITLVKAAIGVAKDFALLMHSIEDLRQKKLLTGTIESAMNAEADRRSENSVETILSSIREMLGKEVNGDQENSLTAAIRKLLAFHKKGGEVDFVSPSQTDADSTKDEGPAAIAELRDLIEELRSDKEEVKMLTDRSSRDK